MLEDGTAGERRALEAAARAATGLERCMARMSTREGHLRLRDLSAAGFGASTEPFGARVHLYTRFQAPTPS